MAIIQDIQLDATGDLMVVDGDFSVGEVLYQDVFLILESQKGEWRQSPTVGAGIEDFEGENDFAEMKKTITEELTKDGKKVTKLSITESEMIIECQYND